MRHILCVMAVFAFLAPSLPAAEHDGFVGAWQLDMSSSPIIDGKPVASATLTIDYRRKMVQMSESINFADGSSRTVAMEWKLDHKYHAVAGGGGEYLAKWEGASVLAAEHEVDRAHESIRLLLSPDGRSLTETIHSTGGSGDRALIWKR
jgi:hypothetical protein